MDTCNEKYQNIISTCEETRNMIHEYSSRKIFKYILIISLNKCESNKYEMIIYETFHILQEGSNRILSKVQNPSGLVLM